MKLKSRVLNPKDYDKLTEWWKWWRFPVVDRSLLPDNGCGGFMVESDGVELVAGFLYFTNSSFALCEYIVSNPEVKDKELRNESIKFLIDEISKEAKANGVKALFTVVKNKNLEDKYLESGYVLGSKGSNELIKIL